MLLDGQLAGAMSGVAAEVELAAAELDEDEDVKASQPDRFYSQEVAVQEFA